MLRRIAWPFSLRALAAFRASPPPPRPKGGYSARFWTFGWGQMTFGEGQMTPWGGPNCSKKSILFMQRYRQNVKTVVWRGPNHGFRTFWRGHGAVGPLGSALVKTQSRPPRLCANLVIAIYVPIGMYSSSGMRRCLISDPLSLKRHSSESNRPTSFLFNFHEKSNIFFYETLLPLCASPPLIWLQ